MKNSKIEWTHHTQNFWWGCEKIAPECANCYIGPLMRRFGLEPFDGPIRTKGWSEPFKWNKALKTGWPHVWIGVTAGVSTSLSRLNVLRDIPATVKFVSCEPLLGPLNLHPWLSWLDWVIAGGESGYGRRPAEILWFFDLAHQCEEQGVPFFMKQDSGFRSGQQRRIPDDLWGKKEFPQTDSRRVASLGV